MKRTGPDRTARETAPVSSLVGLLLLSEMILISVFALVFVLGEYTFSTYTARPRT